MEITKEYLQELEIDLGWVVLNVPPQLFLRKSNGPWICGKDLTMADIAWFVTLLTKKGTFRHISASRHVSLVRFLTFGCAYLWEDLPNVHKDKIKL